MAQISDERISELDGLSTDEITKIIRSAGEAAKWCVPFDHTPGTAESDKGTLQIPVSRLGLLTSNRLVPQSMLPNKVGEIKFGNMETSGTNMVFTETGTGTKYAAPDPTQVSGAVAPDTDTIYVDNNPSTDYNQYRFVEKDTPTSTDVGLFVPIPSDLIVVDGKGTEVVDDKVAYTRQIDLRIGYPATIQGGNNDGIGIANNNLVHVVSGVTSGSYGTGATPGFGAKFTVPYMNLNNTGHVTEAGTKEVTVPATAATSANAVPGLVKIGTTAQDIKAASSAGTTVAPANGYVEVAAADHTHKAYTLTLSNNNVSGGTTYNGTTTATYDFTNVLKCALPDSAPTGSANVLAYDSVMQKAAWADMENLIVPRLATATGTISGGSVSYVGGGNGHGLSISVSGTILTLTGTISGHIYHVTYGIRCQASAASNYLYTAEVSLANSGATPVEHLLNGSYSTASPYTGIPLNDTGMFTFVAPSSGTLTFGISVSTTGVTNPPTWTCYFTSIEVAEIK